MERKHRRIGREKQLAIRFVWQMPRNFLLFVAIAKTFEYSVDSTNDLILDESQPASVVCQSIVRSGDSSKVTTFCTVLLDTRYSTLRHVKIEVNGYKGTYRSE